MPFLCPAGRAIKPSLLAGVLLAALAPALLALAPAVVLAKSLVHRRLPAELGPLLTALEAARYAVFFAPPPIRSAYGATDPRRRLIWLAPVAVELGIARQALIHEAVHAAQACPGGQLRPIGWNIKLEPMIAQEINTLIKRGYPRSMYEVEREAFALQSHPQAIPMLVKALRQRCR
jgi:hypothetical protein